MYIYFQRKDHNIFDLKKLASTYKKATEETIICTITDLSSAFIYVNEIFCKTSQYSKIELIGKTHNIVNAKYHSNDFFKEMWETIIIGNEWLGEIKSRAKDGSDYWLDTAIIPIKNKKGVIVQFVSLSKLITDKKNIEEKERKKYTQDLEKILFIISHEVRHPVANLLGIANIFENIVDDPIESAKLIGFIKNNAHILNDFTSKLTSIVYEMKLDDQTRKSKQICITSNESELTPLL